MNSAFSALTMLAGVIKSTQSIQNQLPPIFNSSLETFDNPAKGGLTHHRKNTLVKEQVRIYYGSGTVHRTASWQPPDVATYAAAGACVSFTRWQHFSVWNDVLAAIL